MLEDRKLLKKVAQVLISDADCLERFIKRTEDKATIEALKKEIESRRQLVRDIVQLRIRITPTQGYLNWIKGEKEAVKNYNPPCWKVTG